MRLGLQKLKIHALALFAGLVATSPAAAQTDLFSKDTVSVEGDLRIAAVNGEPGWIDGGFGKLRFGSDGTGTVKAKVAEVDAAWKPRIGWALSGLVSITHQAGQDRAVDVNEGFIKFKPVPKGNTRISARAGLMYPPISLEHSGPNWTVTDSITPSAINSWIGEEVKVVAAEATIGHKFGGHDVSVTGAAFGFNDTSGTLLSYRGWALHDVKATAFGALPLPPLSDFIAPYQGRHTNPVRELDKKVGYYARIDWRPPLPVSFYAFRYDNKGDRVSSKNNQTAWRTSFWNVGAVLALDDKTQIKSQALWGNTLVGADTPWGIPVNVDFSSAYVMAVRKIGSGSLSVRAEKFDADDNSFKEFDNNWERGWSAMIAVKQPLTQHFDVLVEATHVASDRPGRAYGGGVPRQNQTQVQASLRIRF